MVDANEHGALRRELRSHHRADLLYGERVFAGRFVLDQVAARLVLPSPPDAAHADEHTVMIPRDDDDAVQVLAIYETLDPRAEPACDRYLAYHGVPHGLSWTAFRMEAIKWRGAVVDGTQLQLRSDLHADEPRLVRELNADRERLAAACRRVRGERIDEPLAVGVDADGVDVRHRFGVLRLGFDAPAANAAEADERIASLLGGRGR